VSFICIACLTQLTLWCYKSFSGLLQRIIPYTIGIAIVISNKILNSIINVLVC